MGLARLMKGAVFGSAAALEQIVRPDSKRTDMSQIRNFLVLQHPTALGTAVHATPLVAALRDAVADCRIEVAASGLAVEVFRNHPSIDRLIETPSPLRDLRRAVRSLRAQRPFRGESFAGLMTVGNERTLIALQGLLSGATVRVGFTEAPEICRIPLTRDVSLSLIDNNLRILTALRHTVRHFEPQIFITEADVVSARALLAESGVAFDRPIAVFVTQNSGGQKTRWHLDRFVRVIRHAAEKLGCSVVYVGTARDTKNIAAIREAAGGTGISIAGKTSITELTAVLALSDVEVTIDTGPMHVGRAAKVPMVVLGPSWQKPLEWLPVDVPNVRILRGPDCATIPENYQLDEISAESVIAALDEVLRTYPPSTADRFERINTVLI